MSSDTSLHHRYSIATDGCMYCGKSCRELRGRSKYCITFSEALDRSIERAKKIQDDLVRVALHKLGLS